MKMKEKIDKIKKKVSENKAVDSVKKKTEKSRSLLKSGKFGGILLLLLYSAQFLYGCVLHLGGSMYPKPFVFLLGVATIAIAAEIAALIIKIYPSELRI